MLTEVAKVKEIEPGKTKRVQVNGEDILLANVGGKIYAVSNRCGHQNVNLSRGRLEGNTITCPLHQARFDVTTGRCLSGPQLGLPPELMQKFPPEALEMFKRIGELVAEVEVKPLKTYRVSVEGDAVKVEV